MTRWDATPTKGRLAMTNVCWIYPGGHKTRLPKHSPGFPAGQALSNGPLAMTKKFHNKIMPFEFVRSN
jgi:hypothetical protein